FSIFSGRSVVIEAAFGLTARYDWQQYLEVTLSGSYAGKTCGLCGNFNGNPSDDFTTPSGTQADGPLAFGSSWKVPGPADNPKCRDDCVGGCERCEDSQMAKWQGDMFCGLLTVVENGLFRKCHSVIDPKVYLENCKYDLCMGGGLRHFLCRSLEAYTEACQLAGIQIPEWRITAQCPADCPANSHYELCGSSCPATCSDPKAPTKCKRPCVETCTCNTGFVWSGSQCVPEAQCGCSYEGRYIPVGESFWADQGCQQWCTCVAGSRRVECKNKGCGAGQQCQVVEGIRKCQAVSESTCQATGDPHYVTFDKKRFDFQGTCVYQLAALCSKNPELVPFEVLVQNDHRGSKVVAYTKLVEIKVYSLSIVITKTHKGLIMVRVNEELVNLPVTLAEGQVSVYKSGLYAVVTVNFGLKVTFNWESAVFVTLPSNYMDAVCGLCGNYNGKPQDDLIPKNGDKPVSQAEFGTSWKVADIPGCVNGCKGVCPDCDINQKVQYEKGDFCGILRDPKGPFRDCHAKVDPAGYFEDCVYDVCLYKGKKDVLCQAITAYTTACQSAGAKVYSWRTNEFCAVKCPANSHYEVYADPCPATCQSLGPPVGCQGQWKEGCSCDEGYMLSGDICVPYSQCGCFYKNNNRYYRIGEVFYPSGECQEECNCTQSGQVVCKKFSCGPNEKCKVEDAMKCPANSHYEECADACFAPCPGLTEIVQCPASCTEGCQCDPGFAFNGQMCVKETECGCYERGKTYKPGEVVYEENCNTKCTCDPMTGLKYPCKDANCRVKETCRVEKGEAVCIPDFTGICWAWGDPHYHTFDGYNYDFQGTCKYIISQTCGNLDGLVPFSITERNDNRGNAIVSYVRDVDVSVYGYTITMSKNQIGRVTVNGELLNLPVRLGDGEVSLYQSGANIVAETKFGLIVTYDCNWSLYIKLPSSYYGSVCGLCGNFNGKTTDELQNPAGKAVSSVIEFGKSWQTPDQDKDYPCWDTCEKDCPTCDGNLVKLYETEATCGALAAKTNGVFQQCHGKVDPQAFMNSCVYDVCMNKGDMKMFCQALASYDKQCREQGIIIKGWRAKFNCPMNCQPHSHYEDCASACQPSCPFPDEKKICIASCVEACVCDTGYVLSAGVCVPAKTCGCSYQGRYYKPGQRFWADEACGRLCECDTSLQMVTCREASCSANEFCTVVDGERACKPISYATCTAAGDPHYHTFDGKKYDFQGTCVYQLVGLCSQQPGLVPFKVTVQNDHRGSNAVAYTRTVTFSIYGITLTISREYPNRVLLNGQLALLPLDYNNVLVVFLSGRTAVVETAAGITVTYDWWSTVSVTLPSNYQSAVCGLCGNYNGKAQDDLTMQSGQIAPDATKLGESWQVATVPGCAAACQGPWCQVCSDSQKKVYEAQTYCGIIADKAGPFRDCHRIVDPTPYLEDCMYDACQYHGHQGSICDAVKTYVSACQSQGITIYSWRTDSFCPMVCAANSHYTLCARGCPTTCASLTSLTTCHRNCTESCECDQNYILSGGTCVPVKECGCSYNGQYYKKGDVFYPEDKCMQQCVCGENGAVTCQQAKCRPGEICMLKDGVQGCHPEGQGKCVASGDPHYISFDGRKFDFQGTCVYVLAKVCGNDNEPGGYACTCLLNFKQKYIFCFSFSLQVNDEILNLPLSLGDGRVKVTQEGLNVVVRTDFGLTALYDTVYYVEVIVPSTYQGKMCGLCGNYNKNAGDDFILPGASLAHHTSALPLNSWHGLGCLLLVWFSVVLFGVQ
uniref:VWFD domain-containing protein n=1 Tax=Monopterus albus TaxID=43700 RepID=A0A3Q3INL2_MONAL